MGSIETLDDVIEGIADICGVYGCGPEEGEHPDDCRCRICFTAELEQRIIRAVEVDRKLNT